MILHFTEKKNCLQAFYSFEIKLSLIVLVFCDTNINTDVDVFVKTILSTMLLLNKCWQINITQHQCKDVPIEHKVYKIDALLHISRLHTVLHSPHKLWFFLDPYLSYWHVLFSTTQNNNKYRCYLLSKHVPKYAHHLQFLQMKSIPSEDHTALPWTWLPAR